MNNDECDLGLTELNYPEFGVNTKKSCTFIPLFHEPNTTFFDAA